MDEEEETGRNDGARTEDNKRRRRSASEEQGKKGSQQRERTIDLDLLVEVVDVEHFTGTFLLPIPDFTVCHVRVLSCCSIWLSGRCAVGVEEVLVVRSGGMNEQWSAAVEEKEGEEM